jgi:hypothetical protein
VIKTKKRSVINGGGNGSIQGVFNPRNEEGRGGGNGWRMQCEARGNGSMVGCGARRRRKPAEGALGGGGNRPGGPSG